MQALRGWKSIGLILEKTEAFDEFSDSATKYPRALWLVHKIVARDGQTRVIETEVKIEQPVALKLYYYFSLKS